MMGQIYADALAGAPVEIEYVDGTRVELETARWFEPIGDEAFLSRCAGPTLDIGSGPGRLAVALNRRGVRALGIDITPRAVAHTRRAGGFALLRDVFDEVPGSGRWAVRLHRGPLVGDWFGWVTVSVNDIQRVAGAGGFPAVDCWTAHGRWLACLS
ncbi:methyltransferase domain-containing protein [Nonomuraea jabiensis]|uniref:methyltransferase domain-containing protein n=1 Tax=Nonomuraea jabiensis TaxID=882448 RepID=UPI0036B37198